MASSSMNIEIRHKGDIPQRKLNTDVINMSISLPPVYWLRYRYKIQFQESTNMYDVILTLCTCKTNYTHV